MGLHRNLRRVAPGLWVVDMPQEEKDFFHVNPIFTEEAVSRLREDRIKQLYLKGKFVFDDKNPPVQFGAFPPGNEGD